MAGKTPTVLAFMAHPDDIEIQCGGTLCRLREAGWQVAMATMTHGDCGSAVLSPDEIAGIRTKEAEASAALIGAEFYCADLLDVFVFLNAESLKRTVEIMRRVQPDVVITHPPLDYMLDHEQASVIVRDATFGAPIKNVFTDAEEPAPPLAHIPHLYYVDPLEGKTPLGERVQPGFYVDVTGSIEQKESMLACHASQREWLRAHHGIDEYILSMKAWNRRRGAEVGVEYAEAFRQHLGHAYPRNNIIGETLGALVP